VSLLVLDGVVLVPAVCLIEAAQWVDDTMLRVLVDNPVCEIEPLTGERWPMAATTMRKLGRLDLAVTLLAATAGDGFVLTGEPDEYGDLGADVVIGI
jgi:hypothetical protein